MEKMKSILSQLRVDEQEIESSARIVAPPQIRKSKASEFFQVHATTSYTFMALINVEGIGFHFVAPEARESIKDELRPIRILPCMNREGETFFYPQPISGKNGFSNSWSESQANGLELGKKKWIRMKSGKGCYDVTPAPVELSAPDWSAVEKNMDELLEAALKPCFIEHPDHIILRKLRGEI